MSMIDILLLYVRAEPVVLFCCLADKRVAKLDCVMLMIDMFESYCNRIL